MTQTTHQRAFSLRLPSLLAACAICLVSCSPSGPGQGQAASKRAAEDLAGAFDRLAADELGRSPETASRLGLSEDQAGYPYKSMLDDRSQASFERLRLLRIENLEMLERVDVATLPEVSRTQFEITLETYRSTVDMARFGHGHVALGYARPYAADHLNGAYLDVPELLMQAPPLRDLSDVEAFLGRLSAFTPVLDDERRRLIADAAAGITPPDFILARMLDTVSVMLGPAPVEQHPLLMAFQDQLNEVEDGITAEMRIELVAEAAMIIADEVQPAYRRYADTLGDLADDAPSAPGVWQIPNGGVYYEASLALYTGTDHTPDSLAQIGEQLVVSISAELDAHLTSLGFAEGTVGERLGEVSQLEGQIYPDDEAGRAALLEKLRLHLRTATERLDDMVPVQPRQAVMVEAIPPMFETGHPGGYYQSGPVNGGTPARFYINLKDPADWPALSLATLVFHETIPGHHLESTYDGLRREFPLVRQLIWLPAYGEGWAVYAEDIARELGFYEDDPLGEIGYLQSLLFRAARLVADTGLHHGRWTREDAIAYLVTTTGLPVSAIETEVDRYAVWPGQAAAYMLGRLEILRLRNRAEEILGSQFSLPGFHDAVLRNGPRQFSFVERDVDAWISEQLEN